MIRAAVIAAALMMPATAAAGPDSQADAPTLSLHDAIAIAVADNPQLGMATMDATAAEADVDAAAGAYDPMLEATAGATAGRNDPTTSPFAQELEVDQLAAAVSIAKQMLGGARVTVRLSGTYARHTSQIPTASARQLLDRTALSPRLELEWIEPLIGGRRAGRAERRGLVATADAAASDRVAAAARVVRDVERAYWQLYLAERTVEIDRAGVDLAEQQLALVRAQIADGSQPRLATAEVEDELARRRDDALIAESAVTERSLDLARALGQPPTGDLRTSEAPPKDWPVPSAADVTVAIDRTPAVAAAIARGDAAAAAVERADDETGWRVEAYARASAAAETDDTIDALTQAAGYGGITAEVGVTVRLPLGDHARRGALDRARASLVGARMAVADAEAEVAAAATAERDRMAVAAQRRDALARSVELAQTNLDAEQRRWERGDTTSFEVLRRQSALAEVKLRAERAVVDGLVARAGLEALTGALLARHGVELP